MDKNPSPKADKTPQTSPEVPFTMFIQLDDGFVDGLARRIASFDRRAIAAAKNLVNQVSLPSADELLNAITSFETALTWPEAQRRIQALLERGLQRDADFEKAWPEVLGTLLDTEISSQSSLQKKGSTL